MPNHITNKLKVNKGDFNEILNAIKGEKELIDFNKIIPMPESLNVSASNVAEKVSRFIPSYVQSYEDMDKELIEQVRKLHLCLENNAVKLEKTIKEAIATRNNRNEYGYDNWYGWCIDKWGTKWNAYESYMEDGYLYFQTAWSTPEPVIEALSKMFPNAEIEVAYADEDFGYNCGIYRYVNGECTYNYEPEGGSKEAKQLATEITGWDFDEEEDEEEEVE